MAATHDTANSAGSSPGPRSRHDPQTVAWVRVAVAIWLLVLAGIFWSRGYHWGAALLAPATASVCSPVGCSPGPSTSTRARHARRAGARGRAVMPAMPAPRKPGHDSTGRDQRGPGSAARASRCRLSCADLPRGRSGTPDIRGPWRYLLWTAASLWPLFLSTPAAMRCGTGHWDCLRARSERRLTPA